MLATTKYRPLTETKWHKYQLLLLYACILYTSMLYRQTSTPSNNQSRLQRPPNGPAGMRGETTTDDLERGGASGVFFLFLM